MLRLPAKPRRKRGYGHQPRRNTGDGKDRHAAAFVVQMAEKQNLLFGGTENYLVAREFRELSNHKERLALLDCLFAVAASKDFISTIEDNEISQIADELRIEHQDFIAVRSAHRDQLAVLKKNL
jgi:hypothetical protein